MSSPVFDTESGFGGNGAKEGNGLTDLLKLGKGISFKDLPSMFGSIGPTMVETIMGGTGGGCVLAGPFKDTKIRIGPMAQMDPKNVRCLKRNLNPRLGESVTKMAMKSLLDRKLFGNLRMAIEMPFTSSGGSPFHTVGHQGVGGEVRIINSVVTCY
jgi:hypothetical protein